MPKKKLHPTTRYAQDITKGKIPANKWVRLACQRHLKDLKRKDIYFDEGAADHIIDFFKEFLCFYEGAFSGKPFILTPHQRFIVGSIFGWKRKDGLRRFRTAYISEGKGNGKALALNTPIPTPTGWTTMGEIQSGDQVFDENGKICNVTAATEIMFDHSCYRIKFSDGDEIIADADHLWKTWTVTVLKSFDYHSGKGKMFPSEWVSWNSATVSKKHYSIEERKTIDTFRKLGFSAQEIGYKLNRTPVAIDNQWRRDQVKSQAKIIGPKNITTLNISKSLLHKTQYNHSIPAAGVLQCQKAVLPIDPWILGYLLGDGDTKGTGRVACDPQDRVWLMEEFNKHGHATSLYRDNGHFGCKGIHEKWQTFNFHQGKYIPDEYLRASYLQRMAFLQGLFDSDGHVDSHGSYRFININKKLIDGCFELLCSIGLVPKIYTRIRYRKGIKTKQSFEIIVASNIPLAKIPRKVNIARHIWKREQFSRRIIECTLVPSIPVRCISVDSPSGMYLAGRNLIPTHNSPLAGGIGLYGITFDDEPGGEVYSAATTRDQAGILFRDARLYAEGSESLKEMLIIDRHNIANPETNSFFRPVSSEHRGLDGKKPHMALIDEIHEHPNDMVVRKMSAGTKTRRNSLIFEITNAGYDRHSICYQHHEYTEKILEGTIKDDSWFGLMTGLDVCDKCAAEGKTIPQDGCPDCDDWRDPKVWEKANPNMRYLGKPFMTYLKRQVNEAKEMPLQESLVKRLNFCIWVEGITKWILADKWNACRDSSLNIEDHIGLPCYAAFDLATRWDIAALILLFILENGDFAIFGKYYLPEETIRESKNEQYKRWVKDGHITQTPGARTDFKFIEDDIKLLDEKYHILQIAYDPKEATYLVNNLMDWMKEDTCVEINQGAALMSEPMKELEARVLAKQIWHNGDPVLAWMISNVVLKEHRGGPVKYYYPTKTSVENKIDGAISLIMAIGRAMLQTDVKSAYEGLTVEEIRERMTI